MKGRRAVKAPGCTAQLPRSHSNLTSEYIIGRSQELEHFRRLSAIGGGFCWACPVPAVRPLGTAGLPAQLSRQLPTAYPTRDGGRLRVCEAGGLRSGAAGAVSAQVAPRSSVGRYRCRSGRPCQAWRTGGGSQPAVGGGVSRLRTLPITRRRRFSDVMPRTSSCSADDTGRMASVHHSQEGPAGSVQ